MGAGGFFAGHDDWAIDISPGAVDVCRLRGVEDARLLSLEEIDESLGVFGTVLLMCGNFGLAGGAALLREGGADLYAVLEKT